jgi:hypothetical protein
MDASADAAVRRMLDRSSIHELAIQYAYAVDDRDEELFASLWVRDAVLSFPQMPGMTLEGHDAVVAFVGRSKARPPGHHLCTNHQVRLNGDLASGRVKAIFVGSGSPSLVIYEDEYQRVNDDWRFRRRVGTFHPFGSAAAGE